MTAKIDWYREVLELEPNSKVFFPLARLLAAEGEEQEAMELLEKGLSRHPEYLEARLFRIELLYKAGNKQECNIEIEKLSKMFASYAGFWQAWAACLASDQEQSDTASMLRFLAAHFVSGPLKLHEVLNRGLDVMLKEGAIAAPKEEAELPPAEPIQAEELPVPEDEAIQESVIEAVAEDEAIPPVVEAQPESSAAEAAFSANPEAMLEDLDAVLEAEEPGTPAMIDEEPALPEPEEELLPAVEDHAIAAEMEAVAETQAEDLGEAAAGNLVAEEAPVPEMAAEEELAPIVEEGADLVMEEAPAEAASIEAVAEEPALEMAEEEPVEAAVEMQAEEGPADLEMEASMEQEAAPQELPEEMAAVAQEGPEMGMVVEEAPMPEIAPEPEPEPIVAEAEDVTEEPSLEEQVAAIAEAEFAAEPPAPPADIEQAEAAMVNQLDLPDMEAPEIKMAAPEPEPVDGDDYQEEPFSLRTRSMAEVLAEQGDIQGALDIYRELAEAATSSDEAEDINRRIATLQSRLDMANASAGFKADEAAAEKNREKLIGMLEALAQRVEARAQ